MFSQKRSSSYRHIHLTPQILEWHSWQRKKKGKILCCLLTCQQRNTTFIIIKKSTTAQLLNCWQIQMWCETWYYVGLKNIYYIHEPWDIDFSQSFPNGVNKNILNGFFPDAWLLVSTCEYIVAFDLNKQCYVSPCAIDCHNNKNNDCHSLDNILLPFDKSHLVAATNT